MREIGQNAKRRRERKRIVIAARKRRLHLVCTRFRLAVVGISDRYARRELSLDFERVCFSVIGNGIVLKRESGGVERRLFDGERCVQRQGDVPFAREDGFRFVRSRVDRAVVLVSDGHAVRHVARDGNAVLVAVIGERLIFKRDARNRFGIIFVLFGPALLGTPPVPYPNRASRTAIDRTPQKYRRTARRTVPTTKAISFSSSSLLYKFFSHPLPNRAAKRELERGQT